MKQFLFLLFFITLFIPLMATGAIDLNLEYPRLGNIELNCDQITEADKAAGVRCGQDLNALVAWIYYLIVGISGLAAFAMLVWGGMQWLSSAGNPGQITDAKDRIQKALLGLLLVLGSFLIIQIINPDLTILKEPGLTRASMPSGGGSCSVQVSENCSVQNMISWGWSNDLAIQASQICQTESSGQEAILNNECLRNGVCDFSGGLFQYNYAVHCKDSNGNLALSITNVRPRVFDARFNDYVKKCTCTIRDLDALNTCLTNTGMKRVDSSGKTIEGDSVDLQKQSESAKTIYDASGNWIPWKISAERCSLL